MFLVSIIDSYLFDLTTYSLSPETHTASTGWTPCSQELRIEREVWVGVCRLLIFRHKKISGFWEMLSVSLRGALKHLCDVALLVYLGETVVNCGVYQTFWEAPFSGYPERKYTQVDGNLT